MSLLPELRTWRVECIGFARTAVRVNGEEVPVRYDAARNALCFTVTMHPHERLEIEFCEARVAKDDWLARAKERLHCAQTSNDEKEVVWQLLNRRGRSASVQGTIQAICVTSGLDECLAEVMFAQDEE